MLQASVDAGPSTESATETSTAATDTSGGHGGSANLVSPVQSLSLSPDLEDWIWQDNRNFIQDNNIFDHNYFNFMWQVTTSIPAFLSIILISPRWFNSFLQL